MPTTRIPSIARQLWKQSLLSAQQFDERTHGWLGMLAGAAKETLRPDSAITAAAIAYFAIFSLFPLVILSVSIASFYAGPLLDQQFILQKLEFIAPSLGQLLGQNIDEIIKVRGPVTSIALLGLIWSASTIFYILNQTLYKIWSNNPGRRAWKRRGWAILFVLLFTGPVLFAASFASSMLIHLNTRFPIQMISMGGGISLLVAVLLDVAFFMLLYSMLSHGASTWREILPGALGAGVLWELAKKIFLSFVSSYISISNLVYGSVTTIIAFLAWAYLSSLILLFGAYLSVSYFKFKSLQKATAAETYP